MPLRTLAATRYVTPLREGGSLPAIVEAEDAGLYVLKFRGAGQGANALVAEVIAGEIARTLGLRMPELVLLTLDGDLGRSEPDPEIQDLIRASAGVNLGLDYLPGAAMFDPLADAVAPDLASAIVWFDALVSNVDRTVRNTNMLVWHRELWLIDHGAALFFHHATHDYTSRAHDAFARIADHVLLPLASRLAEVDTLLASKLDRAALERIAGLVPDDWLSGDARFDSAAQRRAAYVSYLEARLAHPRAFVTEALRAHTLHV